MVFVSYARHIGFGTSCVAASEAPVVVTSAEEVPVVVDGDAAPVEASAVGLFFSRELLPCLP